MHPELETHQLNLAGMLVACGGITSMGVSSPCDVQDLAHTLASAPPTITTHQSEAGLGQRPVSGEASDLTAAVSEASTAIEEALQGLPSEVKAAMEEEAAILTEAMTLGQTLTRKYARMQGRVV